MVMASLLTSRVVFIRMCFSSLGLTPNEYSDVYSIAIISIGVMGILAFATTICLVLKILCDKNPDTRRNSYRVA